MRAKAVVPLLLVLVAASVNAAPPTPKERLERARVCMAALDFDCAEAELREARAALATLAGPEAVDVLRLSAEAAFATGRKEAAASHVETLLGIAPDFEPGAKAWPPVWREVLQRLRAALPDRAVPELEVEAPGSAPAGRDLELKVRATDPSGVGGVTIHVDGTPPRPIPLATADGRTWTGVVPGPLVAEPGLDLWITAFDLKGNGPAEWGTPGSPRRIPVSPVPSRPPAERPSILTRWWFWTAVGVVAAGTGVGIWLLARNRGSDKGPTGQTSGTVHVEVQWPSLSD
jgi:hypothetical protein